MTVTIKPEGLDKLTAKFKSISDLKFIKAVLRAAGETVKGKIAKYPSATSANQPNDTGRWYERGYGPKWMTRAGVHGRATSETLGRRWTTRTEDNGLTVIVGNNASYGPYVQDRDSQASFHTARGWRTIQDVAEEEGPRIIQQVKDEVEKKLAS
jgi:hypothetical protein